MSRGVFVDLAGRRFGRLTVVSLARGGGRNRAAVWRCRCGCGAEIEVERGNLIDGRQVSCGQSGCKGG